MAGLQNDEQLKVEFPMQYFLNDIALLDPLNTHTVWEYYLLENIACGLVRNDSQSPSGFVGCLADEFYQPSPNAWEFVLKKIKWSDNSPVAADEIIDWAQSLTRLANRHAQYLKHIEKITYDQNSRKLKFYFIFNIDRIFLHELSLADASFLPVNYKKKWLVKNRRAIQRSSLGL